MEIIQTIKQMQSKSDALWLEDQTIALVPTMGFFHEGHIELMRVAKENADKLIVSIFVNPTQFCPADDYDQYPRDLENDLAKAREVGVDIIFTPSVQEMYPGGFLTEVKVKKITQHLCGISRPKHFDGVTTVVAKLFNIVKPLLAVFGQKDYQQLTVISRMVMDLNMDIRIIGVPTVREPDGLAMSSRNSYLGPEERKSALCLKKSLSLVDKMFQEGENRSDVIKGAIESYILSHSFTEIDYISLCDTVTLEEVETLSEETLLALAVRVGKIRLIDNCVLRKGPG